MEVPTAPFAKQIKKKLTMDDDENYVIEIAQSEESHHFNMIIKDSINKFEDKIYLNSNFKDNKDFSFADNIEDMML